MAVKYVQDKTGELKKVCEKVKKKKFKNDPIHFAKIQYIFWNGEQTTNDGRVMAGEARIPTPRERDLYGIDFIISMSSDIWFESSVKDKARLAFHELCHCIVLVEDEDSGKPIPKYTKQNRLAVKIRPHDINVNIFRSEIENFGLSDDELNGVINLYDTCMTYEKKGKKKKKNKK